MADSTKVVGSCLILTLGSTVAKSVLPTANGGDGKLPSARLLIGTSLTFMGLAMLADFAPKLATPLALLITSTAVSFYGIPIADNYFNGAHNPVGIAVKSDAKKVKVQGTTVTVDTGNILG